MISFKIKYTWYEGDEGEYIISHKTKDKLEVIEDMKQIQKIINECNYEKDFRCLPSAFNLMLKEFEKLGYDLIYYPIFYEFDLDNDVGHNFKITEIKKSTMFESDMSKFFK